MTSRQGACLNSGAKRRSSASEADCRLDLRLRPACGGLRGNTKHRLQHAGLRGASAESEAVESHPEELAAPPALHSLGALLSRVPCTL